MTDATLQCKCEHWQVCPMCKPEMYQSDGQRKSARLLALGAQRHDLQELVTAVKDALYSRPGRPVNVTEAFGVLELVKHELFWEMQHAD